MQSLKQGIVTAVNIFCILRTLKISLFLIAHLLDMYVYDFPLYDTTKNMQAPSSLAACSVGLQSTAETING